MHGFHAREGMVEGGTANTHSGRAMTVVDDDSRNAMDTVYLKHSKITECVDGKTAFLKETILTSQPNFYMYVSHLYSTQEDLHRASVVA